MESVLGFKGEYRFLSNFYTAPVELDGIEYKSTEHAYQAAKTLDASERRHVREAVKPNEAKELGQNVKKRPEWEQIKISVMKELVKQKFTKHKDLKEKLLATGDAYLEETNHWHDTFWGVCKGKGENHLGKILMEVREEIKND
jgi:ribA/ribD-fused uncharacterized protein